MDRPSAERRTCAERFADLCAWMVGRLPARLQGVVAPSFVGFVVINGLTFGVDLAVVTLLHGSVGLPVWAAISVGYMTGFGLAFVLNRRLNFRSHAPVGRQLWLYLCVLAVNYVVILLGVGAGLATVGVDYRVARLIAGAAEGVFVYCALRWVVFGAARVSKT